MRLFALSFSPSLHAFSSKYVYIFKQLYHSPTKAHKCCNEHMRVCVRAPYVSLINYYLKTVATDSANVSVYYTRIVTVVNCSRL